MQISGLTRLLSAGNHHLACDPCNLLFLLSLLGLLPFSAPRPPVSLSLQLLPFVSSHVPPAFSCGQGAEGQDHGVLWCLFEAFQAGGFGTEQSITCHITYDISQCKGYASML